MGMSLTQVGPTSSIRRCGRVSAESDGVGRAVCYRGRLSVIPSTTPVADRFSLSSLWIREGVAGAKSVGMRRVWGPDVSHRGHDFSGYADSFACVVSRHVVGDNPEKRGQRFGATKGAGIERIQDSLDDAA